MELGRGAAARRDGNEGDWSWPLFTPSQRIWTTQSCTLAVKTGGVRSPSHHHLRCAHALAIGMSG
jgi:hypothetical protein